MLKKNRIRQMSLAIAGILCAAVLVNAPVYAEEATTTNDSTQTREEKERALKAKEELRARLEAERKAALEKRQDLRTAAMGKLEEAKLRVCEKRLAQIKRVVLQAAQQGEKHLLVFDKISDRVQQFYIDKNLSVANYDALVSDTETKRANAVALIEKTKALTFDCSDANAVGKAETLRNTIKAQHDAMKEYRTSIKNLIVAVKNAAKQAEATREGSE